MSEVSLTKAWYTVKEAAEYLRIAPKTIYNKHCKGLIKGYNSGGTTKGRLLFKKEHLDAYAQGVAA